MDFVLDEDKIEYLKTNVDDWNTVENYWDETYESRRCQLTVQKLSTTEYMGNFRCLQIQKGLTLVCINYLTILLF